MILRKWQSEIIGRYKAICLKVLDMLLEFGVNHIDVAHKYGDAELRVGRWMEQYRKDFF